MSVTCQPQRGGIRNGTVLQLGANARIADDVVAAGASLETKAGSTIAGDLSFMGAQALLAGTVQQNVRGGMAVLEMRGTVGRNVNVAIAHWSSGKQTSVLMFSSVGNHLQGR